MRNMYWEIQLFAGLSIPLRVYLPPCQALTTLYSNSQVDSIQPSTQCTLLAVSHVYLIKYLHRNIIIYICCERNFEMHLTI